MVGMDALLALPSAFSHIHHLPEEIFGVHMEASVNRQKHFNYRHTIAVDEVHGV